MNEVLTPPEGLDLRQHLGAIGREASIGVLCAGYFDKETDTWLDPCQTMQEADEAYDALVTNYLEECFPDTYSVTRKDGTVKMTRAWAATKVPSPHKWEGALLGTLNDDQLMELWSYRKHFESNRGFVVRLKDYVQKGRITDPEIAEE